MIAKRLGLFVALATILGCSAISSITGFNDSPDPIRLLVKDREGVKFDDTIGPGRNARVWAGFRAYNPRPTFTVNGHQLTAEECPVPEGIAVGREGVTAQWRWDGRNAKFTESAFTVHERMMLSYAAVGCACVTIPVVVAVFLLRRQASRSRT